MLRVLHFTSIGLILLAVIAGGISFYYHSEFLHLHDFGTEFSSKNSVNYVKALNLIEQALETRNLFLLIGSVCLILGVASVYFRGLVLMNSDISTSD